MIATMAKAMEIKMSFSGWSVATEIDTNGDGIRAISDTHQGTGTFGKTTTNNQSEVVPVTPSVHCSEGILEFQYVAFTAVTRYQNGDLILLGLDPQKTSTLCYNPTTYTSTATVNLVVLGGTGRFEGAEGWTTATVTGVSLAGEPFVRSTHVAFWGSSEGEIFLSND